MKVKYLSRSIFLLKFDMRACFAAIQKKKHFCCNSQFVLFCPLKINKNKHLFYRLVYLTLAFAKCFEGQAVA